MKYNYLIVFCLIIFSFLTTKAQKIVEKSNIALPLWIEGDMPKKNNQTYKFKVSFGEDKTLLEAKEKAVASLIIELANDLGVNISSNSLHEIKTESKNGNYHELEKTNHTFKINREDFSTAFEKVDEYWEAFRTSSGAIEYRCWTLFQVAKDPENYTFDKINFTTNYGLAAVWRSALVPGWGQMHKKQKTKGVIILSSEAVFVAGALTSEYLRSTYYKKATETKDITKRRDYISKSDTWEVSRNIMFVVAGGIYIYNLVDVFTSKGAKKYADNRKFNLGVEMLDEHYCLAFTYKF